MTLKEYKKVGQNFAIRMTSIVILILLFAYLISEVRGDFANGILFFFYNILSLPFITALLFLFLINIFFGRLAGVEILQLKRKVLFVAFKYSICIGLLISILNGLFNLIFITDNTKVSFIEKIRAAFLVTYATSGILITVLFFLGWIWVLNKIIKEEKATEE